MLTGVDASQPAATPMNIIIALSRSIWAILLVVALAFSLLVDVLQTHGSATLGWMARMMVTVVPGLLWRFGGNEPLPRVVAVACVIGSFLACMVLKEVIPEGWLAYPAFVVIAAALVVEWRLLSWDDARF